jgi:hypothetical protein
MLETRLGFAGSLARAAPQEGWRPSFSFIGKPRNPADFIAARFIFWRSFYGRWERKSTKLGGPSAGSGENGDQAVACFSRRR